MWDFPEGDVSPLGKRKVTSLKTKEWTADVTGMNVFAVVYD